MFDIDFEEKGKLLLHKRTFLLYPTYWNDTANHITVPISSGWSSCKFEHANHSSIPDKRGIYCFVVKPQIPNFFETVYLFYIGKTNRTLKQRFSEYLRNQDGKDKPRTKIFEMLKLYSENVFFFYIPLETTEQVDECEKRLLNTFAPPINTDIPNAKIKHELRNIYEA